MDRAPPPPPASASDAQGPGGSEAPDALLCPNGEYREGRGGPGGGLARRQRRSRPGPHSGASVRGPGPRLPSRRGRADGLSLWPLGARSTAFTSGGPGAVPQGPGELPDLSPAGGSAWPLLLGARQAEASSGSSLRRLRNSRSGARWARPL